MATTAARAATRATVQHAAAPTLAAATAAAAARAVGSSSRQTTCTFTPPSVKRRPSFGKTWERALTTFVPLDFNYNSSYRFGGGYRMSSCGDEIRFMFTRFNGDASAVAFPGDIVPHGADPPPDGRTLIDADVDVKTYDLECVKIIPLGGRCGGGCGDACGDCCGKSCPAWDIGWSGGIRWADASWDRSYVAFDDTDFPVTDVRSGMDFPRRRYSDGPGRPSLLWFSDGWLSVYSKGNVSLLLGDVDIDTVRESDDGNTVVRQSFSNRQLIPVFDLEAGLTAQVTCHTAIRPATCSAPGTTLASATRSTFAIAATRLFHRCWAHAGRRQYPGLRRLLRPHRMGLLRNSYFSKGRHRSGAGPFLRNRVAEFARIRLPTR